MRDAARAGALLSYPDAELRAHLPRCARRCTASAALAPRAWPNSTR
jgi:hypothetical protein